jgi:glycosyltransferase involved in cell wall biosynthesis
VFLEIGGSARERSGGVKAAAVSVLMAVKDGLPYLDAAVASILGQTFTDFEFVIVDDASADGSRERLERAAARDPRIVLLRNERNLGQSEALNRGLAECRGEWVARMDADDVALPTRLERQLVFMRENPDVDATSCLAWYIDAAGRRTGRTVSDAVTREQFRYLREHNLAIGILHPGALVRREVLAAVGGYRSAFDPPSDIDLWCRISDAHLILVQRETLMEYRIHNTAMSASRYEQTRLKSLWARDCMIARREQRPEPSWESFLEERRSAPWWLRLNRWRKMRAKRLYRQSAQHYVAAHPVTFARDILLAVLLQPEYALPRLKAQIFG